MHTSRLRLATICALALFAAAACSGTESTADEAATDASSTDDTAADGTEAENASADADANTESETASGIRLVSPQDGTAILENPPEDLVILDVRTPEEFEAGHIEGAIMIDFYDDDFAEQIAALDPDVPYLMYCRSGNRSGQTRTLMEQIGFSDVADVDGGIVAWADALN